MVEFTYIFRVKIFWPVEFSRRTIDPTQKLTDHKNRLSLHAPDGTLGTYSCHDTNVIMIFILSDFVKIFGADKQTKNFTIEIIYLLCCTNVVPLCDILWSTPRGALFFSTNKRPLHARCREVMVLWRHFRVKTGDRFVLGRSSSFVANKYLVFSPNS